MTVVKHGKTEKFWKEFQGFTERKVFVEGVHTESREFSVVSKNDLAVKVQGKGRLEVFPEDLDFRDYEAGTVIGRYKCGDKDIEEVGFSVESDDGSIKVRYLKLCKDVEPYSMSTGLSIFVGVVIVAISLLLNPKKQLRNADSHDEEISFSAHFKSFFIGYAQGVVFLIILAVFLSTEIYFEAVLLILNVLSGLSITYLIRKHLPVSKFKSNSIGLSLCLALIMSSSLFPNIVLQDIQFILIALFLLSTSRFLSVPFLVLLSLFFCIFYYVNFQHDLYPSLSSTTQFDLKFCTLPSTFRLPLFLFSSSIHETVLTLPEVLLPGAYLLKFKSNHKYFYTLLFTYLLSSVTECLIRTLANTSSLFLAPPLMSAGLLISAVYYREFKEVFLENKERLNISEVAMKAMS